MAQFRLIYSAEDYTLEPERSSISHGATSQFESRLWCERCVQALEDDPLVVCFEPTGKASKCLRCSKNRHSCEEDVAAPMFQFLCRNAARFPGVVPLPQALGEWHRMFSFSLAVCVLIGYLGEKAAVRLDALASARAFHAAGYHAPARLTALGLSTLQRASLPPVVPLAGFPLRPVGMAVDPAWSDAHFITPVEPDARLKLHKQLLIGGPVLPAGPYPNLAENPVAVGKVLKDARAATHAARAAASASPKKRKAITISSGSESECEQPVAKKIRPPKVATRRPRRAHASPLREMFKDLADDSEKTEFVGVVGGPMTYAQHAKVNDEFMSLLRLIL